MHTVNAARYWPSPFPASPVSGWTAWPLRISARFKVVVRAISAGLVGIVPVAVLIVIFQERVVSGLTPVVSRDKGLLQ
jgi:hypothetical protein